MALVDNNIMVDMVNRNSQYNYQINAIFNGIIFAWQFQASHIQLAAAMALAAAIHITAKQNTF